MSCGSYATLDAGGRGYDDLEGVHGVDPDCLPGDGGRNGLKDVLSPGGRMSGKSSMTEAGLDVGMEAFEGW